MAKELEEKFLDTNIPAAEVVEEPKPADMLDRLLSAAAPQDITEKVRIERLGGDFTVRAITYEQYSNMEKRCQKVVKSNRTGRLTKQTDEEKLSLMLIAEACVDPNFNDPKVQQQLTERYKVADIYDAIKKLLLIGEVTAISSKILDVSGFEEDFEEIKNS